MVAMVFQDECWLLTGACWMLEMKEGMNPAWWVSCQDTTSAILTEGLRVEIAAEESRVSAGWGGVSSSAAWVGVISLSSSLLRDGVPPPRRRQIKYSTILPGRKPPYRNLLVQWMWLGRMRPAGAMRMRDSTRFGKYEVNDAAIPPPREYPIRPNRLFSPVQLIGDDERTSRI